VHPPRTLQQASTYGPVVVLGAWAVPSKQGSPVRLRSTWLAGTLVPLGTQSHTSSGRDLCKANPGEIRGHPVALFVEGKKDLVLGFGFRVSGFGLGE